MSSTPKPPKLAEPPTVTAASGSNTSSAPDARNRFPPIRPDPSSVPRAATETVPPSVPLTESVPDCTSVVPANDGEAPAITRRPTPAFVSVPLPVSPPAKEATPPSATVSELAPIATVPPVPASEPIVSLPPTV